MNRIAKITSQLVANRHEEDTEGVLTVTDSRTGIDTV